MTIFTASQASQANATYAATQAQNALTALIAQYQYVFDQIQAASTAGATSLTLSFSKNDYNKVSSLLTSNGYTITSLPNDGVASTDLIRQYNITITWGAIPPAVTYPSITAISPTSLSVTVNTLLNVQFLVTGGTAPFTWALSGILNTGLTFNTTTGVLTGTPTQVANEYNATTITVTDSQGKTFSQPISLIISPPFIPSTGIQLLPDPTASATLAQTKANIYLAIALS
jgi:hypothetical protein